MSSNGIPEVDQCILDLFDIGVFKFGDFILKSGLQSPIYFDLRIIVSFPKILETVSNLIWKTVSSEVCDCICGVPYTALPIATVLSIKQNIPMLIRRKEAKNYGTKRLLEGRFDRGQTCLIVEDVVVSGSSVIETLNLLKSEGLVCNRAVVFLDREQGGLKHLSRSGVNCSAVVNLTQVLAILRKYDKIGDSQMRVVADYLESNAALTLPPEPVTESKRASLQERCSSAKNGVGRKVFQLILSKETNLCVAVDVPTSQQLLSVAEKIGPHICILKTHADMMKDFSDETAAHLKNLATKHNFLIFEDRKFADIGNTAMNQYSSGTHRISEWADLVTVHGLPGPGAIQAMKSRVNPAERGVVIVAEMSSAGNLASRDYAHGCVTMGEENSEFVVGFVGQSRLSSKERSFLLFTPGVNMSTSKDQFAQQYVTPEEAVLERGADVIIVGRGVLASDDPEKKAAEYKQRGFAALLKSLS